MTSNDSMHSDEGWYERKGQGSVQWRYVFHKGTLCWDRSAFSSYQAVMGLTVNYSVNPERDFYMEHCSTVRVLTNCIDSYPALLFGLLILTFLVVPYMAADTSFEVDLWY